MSESDAALNTTGSPGAPAAGAAGGGLRHLSRARAVVVCAGPLAVAVVAGLGMLVTHSFNWNGHAQEMWAAVMISVAAGLLAVVPMLVWMGKGAIAIVRLTMLATALRVVLMLAGVVLASGPGWQLKLVPLVVWVGACYLALLIAESGATAWVVRHG